MRLLDRILNRRAAMTGRNFVPGPGVVDQADVYFGHSNAEFQPPEYASYLASSNGVYAAATLRANLLASLPLVLYAASEDKKVITSGRLCDLLRQVNPFWTPTRLVKMTELSLCIWGEAFWVLDRGPSGKARPNQIWWVRADRMTVVPDEKKYIQGYLYEPVSGQEPIPFSPGEVIWMPHPNIIDEYAGLSPLAAARLAADVASAAMQSNRNLFHNGLNIGGVVIPPSGVTYTKEQARALSEMLDRRFKGVDKAHRWGVFPTEVQLKEVGVTPQDAQFLEALEWSLEDISRAYHIPLDILGGKRTYQNFEAAMSALWTLAIVPEARFIANELTEKLLPMFPGEADVVEFDTSGVAALQEDATQRWQREREQLQTGAITINEWRGRYGLDVVAWGDEPLLPAGLRPVSYLLEPPPAQGQARRLFARNKPVMVQFAPSFDSSTHRQAVARYVRAVEPFERRFRRKVQALFRQQQEAILAGLREERGFSRGVADDPFDRQNWEEIFAKAIEPVFLDIVAGAGQAALDDLQIQLDFNLSSAAVETFLREMKQTFAQKVNETTWTRLKDSLAAGLDAGETINELEKRVEAEMAGRIRSSSETIARTEVQRSYTGATLEGWRQSEVVVYKSWLAALDHRTRDSHVEAHGQTVPLDAPFTVGGVQGDGPGLMGVAAEDINCRCTVIAVEQPQPEAQATQPEFVRQNGHGGNGYGHA